MSFGFLPELKVLVGWTYGERTAAPAKQ